MENSGYKIPDIDFQASCHHFCFWFGFSGALQTIVRQQEQLMDHTDKSSQLQLAEVTEDF